MVVAQLAAIVHVKDVMVVQVALNVMDALLAIIHVAVVLVVQDIVTVNYLNNTASCKFDNQCIYCNLHKYYNLHIHNKLYSYGNYHS